jgi:organic radical activating enzyme
VTRLLNFINENLIRLYWNTLRLNKKKGNVFTRGADLVCVITSKCQMHCTYCPMFLEDDSLKEGEANKYPKFEVCSLDEWKSFIERYPEWISQIYISGGEPSFVPYVSELINWLIDRGHHVILFSNLGKPENLYGIKNHWRFVCIPTFHHGQDVRERFVEAYNKIKGRFRIMCKEMEETHWLDFSSHKNFYNDDFWFKFNTHLHAMPDSPRTKKLYLGCHSGYIDGKVKK